MPLWGRMSLKGRLVVASFIALGLLVRADFALAGPPPDPRDVAVQNAIKDLQFILGSWTSADETWPQHDHLRVAIDWEWGAIYIEDNYRRRILVLTFDAESGKYKLVAPKAGGFEVAEVSHPQANTISWVTHPDGPAIQSTITVVEGKLRKIDALLDVDGQVKPELDLTFKRTGPADLKFISPTIP